MKFAIALLMALTVYSWFYEGPTKQQVILSDYQRTVMFSEFEKKWRIKYNTPYGTTAVACDENSGILVNSTLYMDIERFNKPFAHTTPLTDNNGKVQSCTSKLSRLHG